MACDTFSSNQEMYLSWEVKQYNFTSFILKKDFTILLTSFVLER